MRPAGRPAVRAVRAGGRAGASCTLSAVCLDCESWGVICTWLTEQLNLSIFDVAHVFAVWPRIGDEGVIYVLIHVCYLIYSISYSTD